MGVGGTGRGPFRSGEVEAGHELGRRDAAAPVAAGGSAAEDGSVLFAEVSEAAARSGLARGAFAAEAALATARGMQARVWSPLRVAVAELMAAAGLVRRVGTNLNQAVSRLNATGERGEDLVPAAEFCTRVIRRLDEAAEQVRRSIP
jgi:hypothetical protein